MDFDIAHLLRIVPLAVSFSLMLPRFNGDGSYGIFARLGLGFIVSIALFTGFDQPPSQLDLVLAPLKGVLTGVGLGLLVQLVFMGLEWAAHLVEQAVGLSRGSYQELLQTNHPVAHLYRLIGIGVIISLDGHRIITSILLKSLAEDGIEPSVEWSVSLIAQSCLFGIQIVSPLLIALLSLRIGISMVARVIPQMGDSAISVPIQLTIGFVLIGLSLSTMIPAVEQHIAMIGG